MGEVCFFFFLSCCGKWGEGEGEGRERANGEMCRTDGWTGERLLQR